MATPDGLRWILAALMLVVATYHAMRLTDHARGRNRGRIDIEVTHFAMGLAMAAMLVAVLPRPANQVVAGVFLAALAWFVTDAIHSFIWDGAAAARSSALQVPICAAMAYMLLAPLVAAHPAMPGMGSGSHAAPLLAPALAVAVALPALAALVGPLRSSTAGGAFGIGCQLAMTGTAVVMLAVG